MFYRWPIKKSRYRYIQRNSKKIGNIENSNQKVLDATNLTILPGIIDTQVHFREPGSTDVEDLE